MVRSPLLKYGLDLNLCNNKIERSYCAYYDVCLSMVFM